MALSEQLRTSSEPLTPTYAMGKENTEQVLGPVFIDSSVAVLEERQRGSVRKILAEMRAILCQVAVI